MTAMTAEDVERLVEAHEKVMEELNRKKPRRAAKIVCEEFRWLLNHGDFWAHLGDASRTLEQYQGQEEDILKNIGRFVDAEASIFAQLGIDESRTAPILAYVYGGLDLARRRDDWRQPPAAALDNLRDRLGRATDLVCGASKGRLRQARDWLLSWKGALFFGGAAVAAANVVVAVTADSGAISWVSVKTGVKIMKGDVDSIGDILG